MTLPGSAVPGYTPPGQGWLVERWYAEAPTSVRCHTHFDLSAGGEPNCQLGRGGTDGVVGASGAELSLDIASRVTITGALKGPVVEGACVWSLAAPARPRRYSTAVAPPAIAAQAQTGSGPAFR